MHPIAQTGSNAADRFTQTWTILCSSFAALFFGVGLILLVRELSIEQGGVRTIGSVAEVRAYENAEGTNYAPVVEFTASDGRTVKFEGTSTNPPPVRGEVVPIIYSRSDPQDARIDRFIDRWAFPCGFSAIGILMASGAWFSRRGAFGKRSESEMNSGLNPSRPSL